MKSQIFSKVKKKASLSVHWSAAKVQEFHCDKIYNIWWKRVSTSQRNTFERASINTYNLLTALSFLVAIVWRWLIRYHHQYGSEHNNFYSMLKKWSLKNCKKIFFLNLQLLDCRLHHVKKKKQLKWLESLFYIIFSKINFIKFD